MKCAAVDCPAWSCSAVIKAGKHPWGLPAFFDFWEGLVVELRPMVGLISAGAEINPLLPGGVYAPRRWSKWVSI